MLELIILFCVAGFVGIYLLQRRIFKKALEYQQNGQYDAAIKLYTQLLRYPLRSRPFVLFNRGTAYQSLGNYSAAIADFDRLVGMTGQALAYQQRGSIYFMSGDHKKALADLNQAIDLNPHDPNHYVNRGIVYFDSGNTSEGIAEFSRAMSLMKQNPNPLLKRDSLYKYLIPPGEEWWIGVHLNRGSAYLKDKKYEDAIRDFDYAIDRIGDSNSHAFLQRG